MNKTLYNFILLFFVVCLVNLNFQVRAQSLTSIDLTTINVDDLSDQQILNYIKQAENSGYTQAQLEVFARQKGMSEYQISKLSERIKRLSLLSSEDPVIQTESENGDRQEAIIMNESEIFGKLLGDNSTLQLSDLQRAIYGYELFQSENLTFAPNLNIPTPEDYVIGPGDEIHIDLWGATQVAATYIVSPEGTIRPENLRPIYVNGMTIKEFEEMVDDRLAAIYSGLRGENPTIFYQVSLGNIRTINVSIVGEVNKPGNYALNSLSTVYTALYAAGGPTENGTFRNIQLIRNNKLHQTVDLYSFLNTGVKLDDERLRSGDVIIIKPYQTRVEVDGEVKRPGLFELVEGESFEDVLSFASGFTNLAYKSQVSVHRTGDKDVQILDLSKDQFNSFEPMNGDFFEISQILLRYNNRVQIEGAVYREGAYQLTNGLTLTELIEKADGLRGDVYLTRANIFRTDEDYSQTVIPVDLAKLMQGEINDIVLKNEDLVQIKSIYELEEERYVEISGEVADNGVYPFFRQMTVQDLIVISGGLTEGATGASVEISRRNRDGNLNTTAEIINLEIDEKLNLDQEDKGMLLMPFDQVFIRKSPGYNIQKLVSIEGEVISPGIYTIQKRDERISDIVKRALGLTQFAYPEGALLIRRTEFSNSKSDSQLTQEYLIDLRKKLLSNQDGLSNLGREQLLQRLEEIERKGGFDEESTDAIGSKLKKNLIQEISEQDSLISQIEISEKEPVALDLKQILDAPGSKYDYILRDGDVISIPGRLETVRVSGEVASTINLRYDESFSFRDYIDQSGGFLQSAKKGRSYVQYPNGRRKGTKRFLFFKFYPKIEPGTTIFVAKKPERNGLSTAEWLAIASSLATISLTIDRLSN